MTVFIVVTMVASVGVAAGAGYGIFLYKYTDTQLQRLKNPNRSGERRVITDRLGRCAKGTCTYLVMGNDTRKGLSKEEQARFGNQQTVPGQRSDTIMLVRIDARREKAVVVSIPRDLWVDIPHQGPGKITSAYEGGPVRVAEVVHKLTGLEINHFMSVSLAGFEGVVRSIGTVPICISSPLVDPTGFSGLDLPHAGCYDLDASQALAFVRARHICGEGGIPDFNRIGRQQQFLRAVLAKILSPGMVFRAPGLIREVAHNLLVDSQLNLADLIYLSQKLSGVSTGAVDFRSVPAVPGYEGDAAVVHLTPEAQELFRRLRNGKPLGTLGLTTNALTPPSPAVIQVQVEDANSGGKADRVSAFLTTSGFDTAPTGTGSLGQSGPIILYRGTELGLAQAQVVQESLPSLKVSAAAARVLPKGVDVAVVIDAAYRGAGVTTLSPAPTPTTPPPGSTPSCT